MFRQKVFFGLALSIGALSFAGCILAPGSSTTGETEAPLCDEQVGCADCVQCATANPCKGHLSACNQNSSCRGLAECIAICSGDLNCEQQCVTNNPNGRGLYTLMIACIYCDNCPSSCSGNVTCE